MLIYLCCQPFTEQTENVSTTKWHCLEHENSYLPAAKGMRQCAVCKIDMEYKCRTELKTQTVVLRKTDDTAAGTAVPCTSPPYESHSCYMPK
jgi:hypothetical protein